GNLSEYSRRQVTLAEGRRGAETLGDEPAGGGDGGIAGRQKDDVVVRLVNLVFARRCHSPPSSWAAASAGSHWRTSSRSSGSPSSCSSAPPSWRRWAPGSS